MGGKICVTNFILRYFPIELTIYIIILKFIIDQNGIAIIIADIN